MTARPHTISGIRLAALIKEFDLPAMRAEVDASRARLTELGWPEPHAGPDDDADLCFALTECQSAIRAYQERQRAKPGVR